MKTFLPAKHLSGSYELELHFKRPLFSEMKMVRNSLDASTLLRSYIDPKRIDLKEFFWVMLLTQSNRLLGISEIATGTSHFVYVGIKEIIQLAVLSNASFIVVAHNHPSGNLDPSDSDRKLAKKLQSVFKIMDIILLDHIILSSEGYTSFSDNDWL